MLSRLPLVVLAIALLTAGPAPAQEGSQRPLPSATAAELAATSPEAGTLYLTTERFQTEEGQLSEAERGRLFVPLDRSGPESPVISVEVYRFPAQSRAASERPPIVRLYGGPGFDGLEERLDRPGYYEKYIEPLRTVADVIVVGQRGIGTSRPNTQCAPLPAVPPDTILTTAEVADQIHQASTRCRQFWTDRGLNLKGFTVLEAAADVNAVREAFGYDRIIVRGHSFGSHWGMAVMRNYPETVERAVLSGLEGPNHTYDLPTEVFNALKRIAADAAQDDRLAPRIPDEGLIGALETAIRRLQESPVEVSVEHPETSDSVDVRLDAWDRGDLADGYGPTPDSLHDMAGWPRDVLALYTGDFEEAARDKAEDFLPLRSFPTASYFMLDCGSGITPEREAQLDDDPAAEIVGNTAFQYLAACPAWESDLGDDFRQNVDTEIPTVLVHGTWDLSTPIENAEELAPHFTNGRLVRVERGTHAAFWEARKASSRFADGIQHFLKTGEASRLPDEVTLPPVQWIVPDDRAAD